MKEPANKIGNLSTEEVCNLLMSTDTPDLLQLINTQTHGIRIQEADVSTRGGDGIPDSQDTTNPPNQDDPPVSPSIAFEEKWNWAYDLRERDSKEDVASLAPASATAASDMQLNGHDNEDNNFGEDGSPWSTSILTPGAQDLPLTDPVSHQQSESYQPENSQVQTYQPLYNQPEPFQIQGYPPFYHQPALQQMQNLLPQQVHSHSRARDTQPQYPQQQIIYSVCEQLQQCQPQPQLVAHSPPEINQPYIPVSRASSQKVSTPSEPKCHRIPTHITAHTQAQEWLLPKLNHFTYQYQGHIKTQAEAHAINRVFLSLSHHEVNNITQPDFDLTFPQTNETYRARLKEIFDAIVDWSGTRGWRTKMGPRLAAQWVEEVKACRKQAGLSVEPQDMLDHQIEPPSNRMPSFEEQWKNVVHRKMSDIEIEILSSKILDSAILSQQDQNFIPLWSNNEFAELVRKANNKAGNDKKRHAINRQNGRGVKRPQGEETEDEGEDRKMKKQRI
ncbi:hypothetical protein FBEOM_702 [Fusarium beomiforme]|uniref:Uncharacterized protein n=1 Tax=Fusarium beomiforme TaxID=44412 RepID=A0A9P5E4S8_9HYPO|nr:hypothetical protein FBEOM_702 [Fusarium beomiforme]